jgi:hypothetical protein
VEGNGVGCAEASASATAGEVYIFFQVQLDACTGTAGRRRLNLAGYAMLPKLAGTT